MITNPDIATLLRSIVDNEYHDGREPVDNPVWVDCLDHGFTASKVGGLFSAAIKAKFATTYEYAPGSQCCTITTAGFEALTQFEQQLAGKVTA